MSGLGFTGWARSWLIGFGSSGILGVGSRSSRGGRVGSWFWLSRGIGCGILVSWNAASLTLLSLREAFACGGIDPGPADGLGAAEGAPPGTVVGVIGAAAGPEFTPGSKGPEVPGLGME